MSFWQPLRSGDTYEFVLPAASKHSGKLFSNAVLHGMLAPEQFGPLNVIIAHQLFQI